MKLMIASDIQQIKQLLELIIQEGRGIEQESFIEVDLC